MLKYLYEPFKKWSDGGQVWVYSDPHFEDNDCKFMSADWPTPQEQVAKINSKVGRNDTIIILGDIGNPEYIKQIKGYKVMLAGNHDRGLSNYSMFDEVYGGPLMISDKIILSHEPCGVPWALNIHGHDHSDWAKDSEFPHVNVCSNIIGYTPITLDSIVKSGKVKMVESIHRLAIEKQKLAKI